MFLSENKEQEKKKYPSSQVCLSENKKQEKKNKNKNKRKKEELKKKEMKKFDKQSLILRHPLKSSINDSILMV